MAELLQQYGTFIYLAIFVVIFYMFLIRPQQKQQKTRSEMLGNLKKGDKVINHGGVIGTISEIKDDKIVVRIADKVEVSMLREGIARVLSN
jgi:preprotein translocase subunit YajC